jgi:hypothetical protein
MGREVRPDDVIETLGRKTAEAWCPTARPENKLGVRVALERSVRLLEKTSANSLCKPAVSHATRRVLRNSPLPGPRKRIAINMLA